MLSVHHIVRRAARAPDLPAAERQDAPAREAGAASVLHDLVGNGLIEGGVLGGGGGLERLVAHEIAWSLSGLGDAGLLASNRAMTRLMRHAEGPDMTMALRDIARSSGHGLAQDVRERMERALGHDFSHVRVHVGSAAARAAEALDAHAFALGSEIFFGSAEYAPGTPAGDRLLAHELTHVVQHEEGRLAGQSGVSSPGDPHEREAYANEARVLDALDALDGGEEGALDAPGIEVVSAPSAAPRAVARDQDEPVTPVSPELERQIDDLIGQIGGNRQQNVPTHEVISGTTGAENSRSEMTFRNASWQRRQLDFTESARREAQREEPRGQDPHSTQSPAAPEEQRREMTPRWGLILAIQDYARWGDLPQVGEFLRRGSDFRRAFGAGMDHVVTGPPNATGAQMHDAIWGAIWDLSMQVAQGRIAHLTIYLSGHGGSEGVFGSDDREGPSVREPDLRRYANRAGELNIHLTFVIESCNIGLMVTHAQAAMADDLEAQVPRRNDDPDSRDLRRRLDVARALARHGFALTRALQLLYNRRGTLGTTHREEAAEYFRQYQASMRELRGWLDEPPEGAPDVARVSERTGRPSGVVDALVGEAPSRAGMNRLRRASAPLLDAINDAVNAALVDVRARLGQAGGQSAGPAEGGGSAPSSGEPVQREGTGRVPGDAREVAGDGVRGAAGALPHLSRIQDAFGRHALDGVRAQVGGRAGEAAAAIGARAYATGDRVAFAGSPDLHTAAHEAAHVVQQQAGVSVPGGVGAAGDRYEQHADAVADRVVAGESAEPLLDAIGSGGGGPIVQREVDPERDREMARAESMRQATINGMDNQPLIELARQLDAEVMDAAALGPQTRRARARTLIAIDRLLRQRNVAAPTSGDGTAEASRSLDALPADGDDPLAGEIAGIEPFGNIDLWHAIAGGEVAEPARARPRPRPRPAPRQTPRSPSPSGGGGGSARPEPSSEVAPGAGRGLDVAPEARSSSAGDALDRAGLVADVVMLFFEAFFVELLGALAPILDAAGVLIALEDGVRNVEREARAIGIRSTFSYCLFTHPAPHSVQVAAVHAHRHNSTDLQGQVNRLRSAAINAGTRLDSALHGGVRDSASMINDAVRRSEARFRRDLAERRAGEPTSQELEDLRRRIYQALSDRVAARSGRSNPTGENPDGLDELRRRYGTEPVQRSAVGPAGDAPPPPVSGGVRLPEALGRELGDTLGADLSGVRVHESGAAPAIGARAYASGDDVVFAPGAYDPGSRAGLALLGHELTHVVQQREGRVDAPQADRGFVDADPALEAEADRGGGAAALVDPWEGEEPAPASGPAATVADTLVRAARGEDVPAEDLDAARRALDAMDSRGTAVVLDRLQQQGLLDDLVDRGILTADRERELLGRVDALVPVFVLVCASIDAGLVDEQVTWAEEAYANAGLRFAVVGREPLDETEEERILGDGAVDIASEHTRGDPVEAEAEALLAAAWARDARPGVSHAVFVPRVSWRGVGGITYNSGNYRTDHPGCLSVAGDHPSTLAHEVGHLLGLGHVEDESGSAQDNVMAQSPPRGFRLSPDQVDRVKRSLRARLIPRSVEPQHTPRLDTPPSWRSGSGEAS